MRFKENWWRFTDSQVGDFLRTGTEGKGHPSRLAVVRLLEGMTSVLDAGCGTGVMFELLKETRPEIDYVGVDVTQKFVDAARARFPADAARFRCQSFLTLSELGRHYLGGLLAHARAAALGAAQEGLAFRQGVLHPHLRSGCVHGLPDEQAVAPTERDPSARASRAQRQPGEVGGP